MLSSFRRMSAWNGKVIADLCVVPVGTGSASVSKEVAHVEKILGQFPLKTKLHAYGTNIEGQWDDVSAAIKQIHKELHESGTVRISSNMRWGSRVDRQDQSLQDKIDKVHSLMKD